MIRCKSEWRSFLGGSCTDASSNRFLLSRWTILWGSDVANDSPADQSLQLSSSCCSVWNCRNTNHFLHHSLRKTPCSFHFEQNAEKQNKKGLLLKWLDRQYYNSLIIHLWLKQLNCTQNRRQNEIDALILPVNAWPPKQNLFVHAICPRHFTRPETSARDNHAHNIKVRSSITFACVNSPMILGVLCCWLTNICLRPPLWHVLLPCRIFEFRGELFEKIERRNKHVNLKTSI